MSHPVSLRFRRPAVADQLKRAARSAGSSTSALAEELIDEGLRLRRHPLLTFRDGATGRRAGLPAGPDVWEVVGGIIGGDVDPAARVDRAARLFGTTPQQIEAVLDYYAEHTDEIDAEIEENAAAAAAVEARWRKRHSLLAE